MLPLLCWCLCAQTQPAQTQPAQGPPPQGQPIRLTQDGDWKGHVRWAPDGASLHFTRIHRGKMELATLALTDGKPTGEIRPFLKPAPGIPQFDAHISPDGQRVAYVHDILQGTDGKLHIHTCAADGTGTKVAIPHVAFEESPRWSPDAKELLWVSTRNGNQEIYRSGPTGERVVRLTNHPAEDNQPWWSPGGDRIVFSSNRDGGARLYVMKTDGSAVKRLGGGVPGQGSESWPVWSPGGERIAFSCLVVGQWEIFTIKPDGSGRTRVTDHPAQDTFPAWSPDGKKLVFCSTRDGGTDLYLLENP